MGLPLTSSGKRASRARSAILGCKRKYTCVMLGALQVLQEIILALAGDGRTHWAVKVVIKNSLIITLHFGCRSVRPGGLDPVVRRRRSRRRKRCRVSVRSATTGRAAGNSVGLGSGFLVAVEDASPLTRARRRRAGKRATAVAWSWRGRRRAARARPRAARQHRQNTPRRG